MTGKQFFLALLVMTLSGLVGGALSDALFRSDARAAGPQIVTANEIRLQDESGRTRALLSILRGRPRFIMLDESGEFRIELDVGDKGEPAVRLRDPDGRERIELSLTADGQPGIRMTDGAGKERAAVLLGNGGAPAIIMKDRDGRDRLAVWQEKDEMGMALADDTGRPRAGFTLRGNDRPSLAFYGEDRKVIWYAPPKQ